MPASSSAGPRVLLPWLHGSIDGRVDPQRTSSRRPVDAQPEPERCLPPVPPVREVLYAHTAASFADAVERQLGRGGVLARALYREFFACGGDLQAACARTPMLAATPALGAAIVDLCDGSIPLSFASRNARPPAAGQTEKYVLHTRRGVPSGPATGDLAANGAGGGGNGALPPGGVLAARGAFN
eukprot:scaffold9695_cov126-Isochrysis_galbana.AAC.1